jgi:hydrogenase nickel incorporation protein HypA/HybF
MHEMSIAMNIIELASKAAQAEGAGSIQDIELEIGTMSGVLIESLEFCFEAASRHTPAEGATLTIHAIPAKGQCTECKNISDVTSLTSKCQHCGAYLLGLLSGNDMKIKAITIDEKR